MKIAAAMLRQWHRENSTRLLQVALLQAERLAQMAPELEALPAQNAWLHEQLEVKAKRIAQLEAALEEAQRAAHRQAVPIRGDPQKRAVAPSGRDVSADIRAPADSGKRLSRRPGQRLSGDLR
jgi:hypothetical protein